MCPGPAGVNSFAGTCNDQGECQGCSEGHGGLQCEFCLSGFYGVPTDPQVGLNCYLLSTIINMNVNIFCCC